MGKVGKKAAKAGKAGPGAAWELGWENKKGKGGAKNKGTESRSKPK